jgi:SpoVK/Ycf46/Vps4 family AAA+-type ATPase
MVSMAERMGQDRTNGVEFNYLFTGAPGTGKTTVARRMGRMFKSLGILPTADVVETSASDFVTGYVNQSGIKTAKIMEDAKGKVLFIDEAYQLNPEVGGGFMSEVVDEIVKALTSESLKNKMVVILAGYERDIDSMLNVNQGLRSRFSEKLHFQNIASDTAVPMLISKLRKNHGLELGFANDDPELPAPTSVLSQLALRLIDAPNFANGRDIETWAKRITQKVAARTRGQSGFAGCVVEESDCREALASLLDAKKQMAVDGVDGARKPEAQGGGGFGGARPGAACPKQQASAPPPAAQTRSSATRSVAKARTAEPEADSQSASEDLDDAEDEDAPPVDPALRPLQDILDDMGLNSEEGVRELAGLNLQSGRMQDIARNLAGKLNTTVGVATEFLKGWQVSQRKMLEKLEQQETDAASGKQKLQAIWRCAVCGRDDKPFVVCWVSPYIVRYTPVKA